ncbi:B-box domain protein 30, partial [Mucuna pruriens]
MSQNHTTSQPIPTSQSVSIQVALGATKWALVGHKFKELLNMCKGAGGEEKHGFFSSFIIHKESATTSAATCCELCGLQASLYCQADEAYLCRKCDKRVHEANFLALRHIRCFLCNTCQNLTRRYLIGASLEVVLPANINWTIGNLPNNRGTYRKSKSHLTRVHWKQAESIVGAGESGFQQVKNNSSETHIISPAEIQNGSPCTSHLKARKSI